MTREEQLACLKDRPCDVCKMRTDKGCISWECVFEQTPDEEKEPCDCISREEVCDYIAEFVNHEYATDRERELVKNIIDGIQHLPSIQPTTKENLVVGDCISRQAVDRLAMRYLREPTDKHVAFYEEFIELPPVTPKPKTGHWIATEKDWWKCSECGRKIFSESEVDRKEFHAWCGRCGAKMLPTDSDCGVCKYQNEVDGSNCYECVKGIRDNYTAEKE